MSENQGPVDNRCEQSRGALSRGMSRFLRARRKSRFTIGFLACLLFIHIGCGSDLTDVPARGQTDPVSSRGDAADDAAIWVNSKSPELSVIIGTDKKAGLHVYAISGEELQFLPIGEANNVDVRSDFPFSDAEAPLVAVSNWTDGTVTLMRFDVDAIRIVEEPVGRIPTGMDLVYGVCLYNPEPGIFEVAATSHGGLLLQWRLGIDAGGAVLGSLVRTIDLGSKAEGCVFDDALRLLYVAEEGVGLWRIPADVDLGDERSLVDRVHPDGNLRADVEGVDLYAKTDGTGFLVVSSQGESAFRIYRREGDNDYVGGFRVRTSEDGAVDGVNHTDGLAVTSASLGPDWPAGLLVVQDNDNRRPRENQNFKLVCWTDVEEAIGLPRSAAPRATLTSFLPGNAAGIPSRSVDVIANRSRR
jgi:3-phytase